MFKFFYAPNTCALASHIALEEAGAEYEAVRVDFKANAQRAPEYLGINPKGRVPSLVTSDGILRRPRRSSPSSRRPIRRRGLLRWINRLPSRACRRSTATSAQRYTSHTRIACAATVGLTSPQRSKR